MTARWVVDEVQPARDLAVTWQPISLLLKNEPAEGSRYHAGVLATFKMLRVMESVRTTEGNEGVFALYWELGTRIHHDGERDLDIGDALRSAGLPESHAAAFEDESFDAEIRRRHDAGLELVGDDVGTPIMVPAGPELLGRIVNVIGEPIDERGPINAKHSMSIHADAPSFSEQSTEAEILVTGIKVRPLSALLSLMCRVR